MSLSDIDNNMDNIVTNTSYIKESGTSADNKDPFVQYFYNLIATVCLMGSISSLSVINSNQANQTEVGKRIDCSPINKVTFELAQLVGIIITQSLILILNLCYLVFILKINFGGDMGMVLVTSLLGNILGVILGYLVAHVGKIEENKKNALLMSITLGGGFLAGLMYGDMKMIIEEKAPIINRINPSAVITDAFYALNAYGIGPRYYRSLLYLLGFSLVMLIIGMLLSMLTSLPLGIGNSKGSANTTSFVTNILGLGFAFLGGTFVDLTVMGDTVAKVGRFTPNYWYSVASREIWVNNAGLSQVIQDFGITLLYGLVCLSIGLAFTKYFSDRN